ncbi:acid beta-fructofuranosidase [Cucurbita maxima]|uniref:beta-fructofuranosidase n=1 Tax=Cucurbita maxima TaxID=3661 RepID=A0A6J1I3W9_CUCMA|nr:acid beta-fructofuranosidase [Cucurbita maxima]
MVKLNPFSTFPATADPPQNLPFYNPLPHEPVEPVESPPIRRRPFKGGLYIFTGLLLVGLSVALICQNGLGPVAKLQGNSLLISKSPKILRPSSRGVSAGVSEKANPQFLGRRVASFPWNNSMLSWQRTAFHFQPEQNWMNDPNGPLYHMGWYHFFYQYNPQAAVWGNIVWGHAVSRDLIHWLHLPLALLPDHWYDINGVWTGSATVLPDGQIMMLYTGSTKESIQVQNLAYPANLSDPLLIDWVKFPGNPVLVPPPGIDFKDFRDPTTAWLTSEGKWRLAVGSKVNRTGISLLYETEDFQRFHLLDNLLCAVSDTGMWECVDFFPVSKTENYGLDTSANGPEVKHVMKTSLDDDRHDYYSLGTYDEKTGTWIPDDPKIDVGIGLRYDYGIFYASKSFYDHNKGRRVLWGWIGESDSEFADVQKGWASVQSIPRTILFDNKTGTNLLQWPVEEVESLRQESHVFNNLVVKAGSVLPLDVGIATQLDISAEFKLDKEALEKATKTNVEFSCQTSGGATERGALGPFGLSILADESRSEHTPVYFYVAKDQNGSLKTFFCTDESRSSEASDVFKPIYGSAVPVLEDEKFTLRILVDHSVVESFAQGGRTCITSRVYPTKAIYGAARLFVFNNAKDIDVIASITVWQMNPALIRPYRPGGDDDSSKSSVVLIPVYLFLLVSFLHLIVYKGA